MGFVSPHFSKIIGKIDPGEGLLQRTDPLAEGIKGVLQKKIVPNPTAPPTQDTASNEAILNQQQMLRRRGIIGNISAGNSSPAPATSKTALGA